MKNIYDSDSLEDAINLTKAMLSDKDLSLIHNFGIFHARDIARYDSKHPLIEELRGLQLKTFELIKEINALLHKYK